MKLKQGFLFVMLFLCLPLFASSQEKLYTIPINDSPQTGPANAPVTIIEFIDFQ